MGVWGFYLLNYARSDSLLPPLYASQLPSATTENMLDTAKALAHNNDTMNRLDRESRIKVLNCILEGCTIRATVRMTGVSKKAVMRLMVEAGNVAAKFQDQIFRNLDSRRIQVDELWGFIYCKQKKRDSGNSQ
jgi:hypothetical protein